MKRMGLVLGLAALSLCGCAHQYVMKLSNGSEIITPHKPKLQGAVYRYKGVHGQEYVVPQSRVLEIEPASMAHEETQFTPTAPKKKHWWKFWG